MADLVGGRYPQTNPLFSIFGSQPNASQGNLPLYSNLAYAGVGDLSDAAAALVTGDMTLVPIPVDIGVTIAKVSILVGATAAGTPTHSWAQLYSGTLTTATPLGSQSADGGSGAIAASGRHDFSLGSAYTIQPADAPYGYIYAAIGETATTVNSCVAVAVATACQYAWFADSPHFFGGTIAAAGATAPASVTLSSVAAIAAPPVVFLS